METIFELWDEEEAHLLNTYAAMPDALAVVAATVRAYGESAVETWGLFRSTPDGAPTDIVAEGVDLARMAMREQRWQYAVSDSSAVK